MKITNKKKTVEKRKISLKEYGTLITVIILFAALMICQNKVENETTLIIMIGVISFIFILVNMYAASWIILEVKKGDRFNKITPRFLIMLMIMIALLLVLIQFYYTGAYDAIISSSNVSITPFSNIVFFVICLISHLIYYKLLSKNINVDNIDNYKMTYKFASYLNGLLPIYMFATNENIKNFNDIIVKNSDTFETVSAIFIGFMATQITLKIITDIILEKKEKELSTKETV